MVKGPERVVIVGAGQAGGWVAKTLRSEGFDGSIVMIGAEPHVPYERPPLSKAVLLGEAEPSSTALFSSDAFDGLAVDFRAGATVRSIDRESACVFLDDGTRIDYDKLVLATGGHARRLAGLDGPRVHTLRTLDDALALGAALEQARSALIVGGGWIGLEIAAAARRQGLDTTLIEMADRLCARAAPPAVSQWLFDLHAGHGADIRLGSAVKRFDDAGAGARAELTSGDVVAADIVVVGTGLIANDELARAAGLDCDNGIVTDRAGRTADPRIFACGDVALFDVPGSTAPMRLESWANAQNQGIACAKAVLGQDVLYDDIPWFWSDQYDANIQILGLPPAGSDPVIRGTMDGSSFSLFWLDGSALTAAVAVNAPTDIKVAKRMMERDVAVTAECLADVSMPMKKLLSR